MPSELTSYRFYRFNPAGNSICGKAATKSPRKVLKSPPWARHLIELKRVRRIALRLDPLLPKQVLSYLSYPPTRNNRGILKHVRRCLRAISIVCRSIRSNNGSNRTNCCRLLSANDLSIYTYIKVHENKQIAHRRTVARPGIRGIIAK